MICEHKRFQRLEPIVGKPQRLVCADCGALRPRKFYHIVTPEEALMLLRAHKEGREATLRREYQDSVEPKLKEKYRVEPGDIIWVKEPFWISRNGLGYLKYTQVDFVPDDMPYLYRSADDMQRGQSRITLSVVRVEGKDITCKVKEVRG